MEKLTYEIFKDWLKQSKYNIKVIKKAENIYRYPWEGFYNLVYEGLDKGEYAYRYKLQFEYKLEDELKQKYDGATYNKIVKYIKMLALEQLGLPYRAIV